MWPFPESSDPRKLVAKLTGGAGFQKEGDFTARAVAPGDDPATLPQPVSIELYDDGGSPQSSGVDPEFGELGKRKRKRKAGTAPEHGVDRPQRAPGPSATGLDALAASRATVHGHRPTRMLRSLAVWHASIPTRLDAATSRRWRTRERGALGTLGGDVRRRGP